MRTHRITFTVALAFLLTAAAFTTPSHASTSQPDGDISNCLRQPSIPGSVSGVIQDAGTGQPIAGSVQFWKLLNGRPSYGGQATADATGLFIASGISAGTYELLASAYSANYGGQWTPGTSTSSFDQATPVTVTSGVSKTGVVIGLQKGFSISGKIVYDNSQYQASAGSAGIQVRALDALGLSMAFAYTTDKAGNYELSNLIPGRYKIYALTDPLGYPQQGFNFTAQYYPNSFDLVHATWVTVSGNVPNIDMTLTKGGVIQGLPLTADTNQDNVLNDFEACPAVPNNYAFYNACFATHISSPGQYIIHAIPGTYRVRSSSLASTLADGRMYAGQTFNHKRFSDISNEDLGDVVTVTQGLTATADFRFDPSGEITGSLVGFSGFITQVHPYLYTDANTRYQPPYSYQNGGFDLPPQRAGDYKLKIDVDGFVGAWYGGGSSYADATTVTVKPHKSVTGLMVNLTPCSSIQVKQALLPIASR